MYVLCGYNTDHVVGFPVEFWVSDGAKIGVIIISDCCDAEFMDACTCCGIHRRIEQDKLRTALAALHFLLKRSLCIFQPEFSLPH